MPACRYPHWLGEQYQDRRRSLKDIAAETGTPVEDLAATARKTGSAAQATAGDKPVVSPDIAQQALQLGLLDEIAISLVPVLLGDGRHHRAGDLRPAPRWEWRRAVAEEDGMHPDDLALAALAALHWGAASAGRRHGWRALSCGRAAILADLRGP